MRITIQVTCDTVQDAQDALARLGRTHKTWDEQVDTNKPAVMGPSASQVANTVRLDKIMGTPERPNVSPGKPSISKIGADNKDMLVKAIREGDTKILYDTDKWAKHLKLLWSRDVIKFDGEEYYL